VTLSEPLIAPLPSPPAPSPARPSSAAPPARTRGPVAARSDGPHVRLGLAWAGGTLVVALLGIGPMAVWMGAAAALAALQVARSARRAPQRPSPPLAAAGAALVPLAAVAGWAGCASGIAMAAVLALLAGRLHAVSGARRRGTSGGQGPAAGTIGMVARRTGVLAIFFGLAAAAPVLLLRQGLTVVLVLLALLAAYDASVYIVGTGAGAAWEGPAAGVAAVGSLTLGVAAILVPPFRGAAPWVLGGLTAVLAPAGVATASRLIVDPETPVQGARRLDSLLLAGPAWAVLAVALLGR